MINGLFVFKFGGASVKDADGIRNLLHILRRYKDYTLFVVVSAMGKTTNSLEAVHAAWYSGDTDTAMRALQSVKDYHYAIADQLHCDCTAVNHTFKVLEQILASKPDSDFDRSYDLIVSNGELLSTLIVSEYIKQEGVDNYWVDMPDVLVTDDKFRQANVDMERSGQKLKLLLGNTKAGVYIAQGFIGGTRDGIPTTLGREGSDYTAAVVANLANAESVTIWKDVPGVMSADPKLFSDAVHIPELTYYDAVELAYSGAQIIHPKTIRPLENKNIPLYVKPFMNPDASGSVIKDKVAQPIDVPVYILRKNQVLITVRPLDFSFVLEDSLSDIFRWVQEHKMKVSLIQSSAVTISVCVDKSRVLDEALKELNNTYRVTYNNDLCLLTVRGTTPAIIQKVEQDKDILLKQITRRTVKLVYRE